VGTGPSAATARAVSEGLTLMAWAIAAGAVGWFALRAWWVLPVPAIACTLGLVNADRHLNAGRSSRAVWYATALLVPILGLLALGLDSKVVENSRADWFDDVIAWGTLGGAIWWTWVGCRALQSVSFALGLRAMGGRVRLVAIFVPCVIGALKIGSYASGVMWRQMWATHGNSSGNLPPVAWVYNDLMVLGGSFEPWIWVIAALAGCAMTGTLAQAARERSP
jgi:hypothetical protein